MGLIELVGTRRKRGTTEKYYLTVAKRFEVDPDLFRGPDGSAAMETATGVVGRLLGNLQDELAALADRARRAGDIDLEREGLVASFAVAVPPHRAAYLQTRIRELIEAASEDTGTGDAADTAHYRFFVSFFPLEGPPSDARTDQS